MSPLTVLSPVFERTLGDVDSRTKLPTGRDCRVALVSNSKASTNEPLFRGAVSVLRGKYGLLHFLHVNKESFAKPLLEDDQLLLLEQSDLVVNAIGD